MQKRTAEKVIDTLGLVEMLLSSTGRPRKRPLQPRPEALDWDGKPIKVHPDNYLNIAQLSLGGAIKLAAMEQGYSRRIQIETAKAITNQCYPSVADAFSHKTPDWYDNDECDTRQVIRDVKAARRLFEKQYPEAA